MENDNMGNTNMEKNNKSNAGIWVAVGIIIAALIIWAAVRKHSDTVNVQPENQNPDAVQVTEDTSTGSVHAPATSGVAPVTESYEEALVKYKNARVQLVVGPICKANPTNLTFKNGTDIMIDNRSAQTHSIKIGDTYSVKGYGFKIIHLSSAALPATWLVDCDNQQNIATILIQK
jgi:hypothetical protein